jgi:hypothetical protein
MEHSDLDAIIQLKDGSQLKPSSHSVFNVISMFQLFNGDVNLQ